MTRELINLGFTLIVVLACFCLADSMLAALQMGAEPEDEPEPWPGWQDEGDPVGRAK